MMKLLLAVVLLVSTTFAQAPSERRSERERQRNEQRYNRHQSGRHFHRGSGSHARRYRYDPVIHRAVLICPNCHCQLRSL